MDGKVKIWNQEGRKLTLNYSPIKDGPASVTKVSFSPNGKLLATLEQNKKSRLRFWDISGDKNSNQIKCKLQGEMTIDNVENFGFSPNGKLIATVMTENDKDNGKVVKLWNYKGDQVGALSDNWEKPKFVEFSPDGEDIAVVGEKGEILPLQSEDLDLEGLLTNSCRWLSSYLNNSPEGGLERKCDKILKDS